ncbi:hypothetical protein UF75_3475 [Desulfosporosinus sp. I2]|nr:hypothetical protein UF75_3475 [Desulfosporosinus sp. I2]
MCRTDLGHVFFDIKEITAFSQFGNGWILFDIRNTYAQSLLNN